MRVFDTALGRDAEEILAVFDALPDTEARMAILRTLRSSVDWHGQVITMVDRAYLAEGIPTLIIWGRRDAIIPLGHGRLIHAVMPGQRVRDLRRGRATSPTTRTRRASCGSCDEFMARSTPATYDAEAVAGPPACGARATRGAGRRTDPEATRRTSRRPLGRVPVVEGSEDEAVEEVLHGGVANQRPGGAGGPPRPAAVEPALAARSSPSCARCATAGFEGVPQPVGIDADGRERLEFIEGDAPAAPYPAVGPGGRRAGVGGGAACARFHRAAAAFDPDRRG